MGNERQVKANSTAINTVGPTPRGEGAARRPKFIYIEGPNPSLCSAAKFSSNGALGKSLTFNPCLPFRGLRAWPRTGRAFCVCENHVPREEGPSALQTLPGVGIERVWLNFPLTARAQEVFESVHAWLS